MSVERSAALIHAYGFDSRNNDSVLPDTRGRLQVLAGLELLRKNEVEVIVFTGGQIDPTKPAIGDVMAEHAKRILPQKEESIISIPKALNTNEEVTVFREAAEKNGWSPTLDIGSAVHLPRIERSVRREFGDMKVMSSEEILTNQVNTGRYIPIVNNLHSTKGEKSFRVQERILNMIDSIPFVGPKILIFLSRLLSNKYDIQSKILKRVE